MNDGSINSPNSAAAQLLAPSPRVLRSQSASPAVSFDRLLDALMRPERRAEPEAEKAAPERETGPATDETPDTEDSAPDHRADGSADASTKAEPRSSSGDADAASSNGDDPHPELTNPDAAQDTREPDAPPPSRSGASAGSNASTGSDAAATPVVTGPGAADAGAASAPTAPIPAAAAEFTTESIARELTHAATVDVSRVARRELVDPKHSEKYKTLHHQDGPFRAGDPGPFRSGTTQRGASQDAAQTPAPSGQVLSGQREPEATALPMNQIRPPQPPTPPEAPAVQNAAPPGADAARASAVAARAPVAKVETPEPVAAPVARAGLLERLTGSAEAARGAVAALDRGGLQRTLAEPAAGRPAPLPGGQLAGNTRDAVLNSVQRGLASVLTQGGGRMTVVLRPEALGEVRVCLEAKDGVVNARLAATTDAARRTLESGLESLRAALEAKGVRVESLKIDPPDQGQSAPQNSGGDRTNADGRGTHDPGGRERSTGPRASHAASDRETAEETGIEASTPTTARGIWTELGIDAVA